MLNLNKKFKKLVVFYSRTGNTSFLAHSIAVSIEADLLEIKVDCEDRFFEIFKNRYLNLLSIFSKPPKLLPYNKKLKDYDLIFLGTPVWSGSYAMPFKTFLKENKIKKKKIALFCSYSNKIGKCLYKLKKRLSGNEIVGIIGFQDPLMFKESQEIMKNKIIEWSSKISDDIRKKINNK
ncbi:MAG: flavodoxin [Spirochaetes bacterium]|nr:flavodoxin [Spirochaetota bacterium]